MNKTIPLPHAPKQKTKADIVFCIDATASMAPCIDGVKQGLTQLVEGLQTAADVDFRLRLIAYRDLHDPTCTVLSQFSDFTHNINQFRELLAQIRAECGQEHRGAESTLDALYLAIHSDWRFSRTHKTIVLFTDDDSHPTLHESTWKPPKNNPNDQGIYRVIQDLFELRHSMLYIVAPRYPLYIELSNAGVVDSMTDSEQKIAFEAVPLDEKRYKGLVGVEWEQLMKMLGKVVSATSLRASEEDPLQGIVQPNPKYWAKIGIAENQSGTK